MPTAKYRFERSDNISGFLSQNRPSTDALKALERWRGSKKERNYEILIDKDEYLVAQLSWDEADDSAGPILENFCSESGVEIYFEGNRL